VTNDCTCVSVLQQDAGYGGKSLFAEEDEEDDGKLDDEVIYSYLSFCILNIMLVDSLCPMEHNKGFCGRNKG